MKKFTTWMATLAMIAAPGPAFAQKVKYEKTEVERARGKCVGSVLGGALLGALVGRATGKDNTLIGAGIGVAAGGVVCAAIMANAKHKDRIIAAQIAAAQSADGSYATSFQNADDGTATAFQASSSAEQQIDAVRLRPVRYNSVDGEKLASPVLTGGRICRTVSSSLTSATGATAALPAQTVCRIDEGEEAGSWVPYALQTA